MAVLSDNARIELWAAINRDISAAGEAISITKADLRAAVDAADVWANDNATSYNSALPQPARSALTAGQKARLLAAVLTARWSAGA